MFRFRYLIQLSTYLVSAVCEYQKGCIHSSVAISEFEYSTTGVPKHRFIIHSGEAVSRKLEPHLLWTQEDFNFLTSSDTIHLTIRAKPSSGSYRYYSMKLRSPYDIEKWISTQGQHRDSNIPREPKEVSDYFRSIA